MKHRVDLVLGELQHLRDIDFDSVKELCEQILSAGKIAVLGAGRSSLALKMLAMRLRHLGFDAYVALETISPRLGDGDLLIVGSGSGNTESICAIAKRAADNGALVWALTGSTESKLSQIANNLCILPSKEQGKSVQFGGNLFEACILLLGDALIHELLDRTDQDNSVITIRHTNLE